MINKWYYGVITFIFLSLSKKRKFWIFFGIATAFKMEKRNMEYLK
jgi:hypothetical protein